MNTDELIRQARGFVAEMSDHLPDYPNCMEAEYLRELAEQLEQTTAQLAAVKAFIAQSPAHQHVADYYRWVGNAQARQELADVLGLPSPSGVFAAAAKAATS